MRKSIVISTLLVLVLFLAYELYFPVFIFNLKFTENTENYDSSLRLLENFDKQENGLINEKCQSISFLHGKKVEKSIVFIHGFTNCPEQFRGLGKEFFEKGFNVFIPRMPFHGYKDRMTDAPSGLLPTHLSTFVDQSVLIASGLGDKVYFSGISGGGVLAAWAGFYYKQVYASMIISPLFSPYNSPEMSLGPLIRSRAFMPKIYRWWDENLKENIGPNYAYPRFSLNAAISFMENGYMISQELTNSSPLKNPDLKLMLITSENDIAVDNNYAKKVIEKWSERLGRKATSFQFAASYNFNHDIIDLNQPTAKPEIVYPKLLELASSVSKSD